MQVDDAVLPASAHLLGGAARDLLAVAVEGAGGRLRRYASEQVLYRPGHDLLVRYRAMVEWGSAPAAEETLVACTTAKGAPPGTMVLRADDLEVAVWRYPFDPDLVGLATAVTPGDARRLLGPLVGDDLRLAVHTFRPRRRAVVEASGSRRRVFAKVVAPAEVARLVAAHGAFRAGGLPVPQVLDVHAELGIVVLEALPGATLRAALGEPGGPSSTDSLVELVRSIGRVAWPEAPRVDAGPLDHVAGHAELIERVAPGESARLARLMAAIGPPDDPAPTGVVHGDLHEAQVLVDPHGSVCGLLDLDDAGLGHAGDDVARLLGHLGAFALGRTAPTRRRVEALATALEAAGTAVLPAAGLRRRVAAVLVAMATGPFRARLAGWRRATSERLSLAEAVLAGDEKTLRLAS